MKKFMAALAAGVVAAVLGTAVPAQAALADCTNYAGTFCMWKNSGTGGSIWRQTHGQVSTTCTSLVPFGWNDTVTTFRNNASGKVFELYQHADCSGTRLDAFYGHTYDLSGNPWNDKVSGVSWRWA